METMNYTPDVEKFMEVSHHPSWSFSTHLSFFPGSRAILRVCWRVCAAEVQRPQTGAAADFVTNCWRANPGRWPRSQCARAGGGRRNISQSAGDLGPVRPTTWTSQFEYRRKGCCLVSFLDNIFIWYHLGGTGTLALSLVKVFSELRSWSRPLLMLLSLLRAKSIPIPREQVTGTIFPRSPIFLPTGLWCLDS